MRSTTFGLVKQAKLSNDGCCPFSVIWNEDCRMGDGGCGLAVTAPMGFDIKILRSSVVCATSASLPCIVSVKLETR
jgi:hypothetical protein